MYGDEAFQARKRELDADLVAEGKRLREEARQREENAVQDADGRLVNLDTQEGHEDLERLLADPPPMPEDWRDNMRGQDARLTGGQTGDLVVGAMSDGSVQLRDEDGNGGWLLGPFQAIETGQQLINMATKILMAQAQSQGGIAPITYQKPRIFTGIPRKGGQ